MRQCTRALRCSVGRTIRRISRALSRAAVTVRDVSLGTACADQSRPCEHPGAKVSTAEATTGQVRQRTEARRQ